MYILYTPSRKFFISYDLCVRQTSDDDGFILPIITHTRLPTGQCNVKCGTLVILSCAVDTCLTSRSSHCVELALTSCSTCVHAFALPRLPVNWWLKWHCFGFRNFFWVAWSRCWSGIVSVEDSRVNWPVCIARVVHDAFTWIPRSATINVLKQNIQIIIFPNENK